MYTDTFIELGLVKNEARIYETLLKEGQSGVGHIAKKSEVHRRNVYDTLNRLMEKGLVYEIETATENLYQAVEPKRFKEILDEKHEKLEKIMPSLEAMYKNNPSEYTVYTYRGKEGLKNYLRDILDVNEDVYFIGASGAWLDPRISDFLPLFNEKAKKQNIKMHHLFDAETKDKASDIFKYVGDDYKLLPKKYSTGSSVDIFGDRVNFITDLEKGRLGEEIILSVIVNQRLADSFRVWYQLIWDLLPNGGVKN